MVSETSTQDTSMQSTTPTTASTTNTREETALQRCVNSELERYFEMLDGEVPHDLHRMVMRQVESALITYVLDECRGNQSKAAQWLGISRGTLRGKLADSKQQS